MPHTTSLPAAVKEQSLLSQADEIYPAYVTLISELFGALDVVASIKPKASSRLAISAEAGSSVTQMASTPLEVLEKLKALDIRLQQYRHSIESHQQLVRKVQLVKEDLDSRNKSVLLLVKRLHHAQEGLDAVLADAHYKQSLMHKANQGSIDFNELLAYAQRVSKHTMSPVNPNTWVVEPPIPQDNHMRMSLLFRQDQLFNKKEVKSEVGLVSDTTMELDLLAHEPLIHIGHDEAHAEALLDLDFE
ncbi:hypothetical protein BASA50_002959 [Batrachochytrium salamandrivorans]|uniref:Mediator of RNA polymerase II transcription subunit 4 n=1 Tax=Batrachochytrium salamandrivorans TaxID=1357716 RepID=A0ABQ8FK03_9FUNG|nr:hypothetical protein BASA60_006725 [Batrachochytrium salamandrivorans]KAH6575534.1 hypothetical protein BASA62_001873 [Batrachochytrium salamandrivorans]KAH6587530.1 hypothetical protein BASA61_006256 [Batrachochytrium salamandrivorans]KAH6599617.1 hypothetical protein BASA50_002959 [Batrachochytrium salamandrivorans]KAH9268023.1 hypothetical protein BASA84_000491 [Batrachochytrium salamandrivorans]